MPKNRSSDLPQAWSIFIARTLLAWQGRNGATSAETLKTRFSTHPYGLEGAWFNALQTLEPEEAWGLSRTDSDAALQLFLAGCPDYCDWARAAIAPPAISIDWRAGQPTLAPSSIEQWERLCNDIDGDAMLCFDLIDRYGPAAIQRIPELSDWKTIPRASDHELRVLHARGLSDLHVHAGGARIPQAAWMDVMDSLENADDLRELNRAYRDDDPARSFIDEIAQARMVRTKLADAVGVSGSGGGAGGARWWDWSHHRLVPERLLLARAWAVALGHDDPADVKDVTDRLDAYLGHKNRFMALVRQPIFAGTPGLRLFDTRYVGALWRPSAKRTRRRQPIFRSSMRFHTRREANAAAYMLESPHLRRIELRLAPFRRPIDYLLFFKHWNMAVQELGGTFSTPQRPALDIRFAVHFLRTARPATDATARSGAARQLIDALDRHTAVLRLAYARATGDQVRLLAPLSRIDMAGQERDTQVVAFALHLRLLRDDPEAMASLEDAAAGHPCAAVLKHWLELRERGLHRPLVDSPRLGITVHAGEDFADVLDGVHQIAAAIEALDLAAGDSVGHGLALAAPVTATLPARGPMLPRGTQHDSLCWLLHFIETRDRDRRFIGLRGDLAAAVVRSGLDIHSADPAADRTADATADDFIWTYLHKQRPRKATYDSASRIRQRLVEADYLSDAVRGRREMPVPLDQVRNGLGEAIRWAQAELVRIATDRRIVIELNPASNVRISGADAPSGSPTVALARATEQGLLACVNTDNPGVFSSCIENEYALLLHGLLAAGATQGEARRILETLRRTGMELLN